MALTFYKSLANGTKSDEIVSGEVGALFNPLTVADRTSGDTEFSKLWIEDTATVSTYIGINSVSSYTHNVFLSASDSDAVGDLTGAEDRYGAMKVTAVTSDTTITVEDDTYYALVRVGDTIIVNNAPYEVATYTDNSDGTHNITATSVFPQMPAIDSYITSTFILSLTAGVAKPVWRERRVTAGAVWSSGFITADILIGQ